MAFGIDEWLSTVKWWADIWSRPKCLWNTRSMRHLSITRKVLDIFVSSKTTWHRPNILMSVLDGPNFKDHLACTNCLMDNLNRNQKSCLGSNVYLLLLLAKYTALDKFLIWWLPFSYRDFVRIQWDFTCGVPWIINNFQSFAPLLCDLGVRCFRAETRQEPLCNLREILWSHTLLGLCICALVSVRPRTELDLQPFFHLASELRRIAVKLTGYLTSQKNLSHLSVSWWFSH